MVEFDHWYAIHLQNRPAGFLHARATRHRTPRGVRRVLDVQEEVSLRRGQDRIQTTSRERSLEDDRGRLVRLHFSESESGGDRVEIQAGRAGEEMVTLRGPEIIRKPFEPDALGPARPFPWVLEDRELKPGAEFKFRTYMRLSAGYSDNRLRILGLPGKDRLGLEVEWTTAAMPGVVQRVRLDRQYNPLRIDSRLGALRLRFERVDEQPGRVPGRDAPDLSPLMKIPCSTDLGRRDALGRARYRIDGLPDFVDQDWLMGPGQKVVGHPMRGTFIIETTAPGPPAPAPFPLAVTDPDLKVWLEETALAQVTDSGLTAAARQVTAGAPDAWTAARRLRRWVSEEISASLGMGFATAREVFRRRRGDCSEQAVLLTTLARASGIPARCVMGLVYTEGFFARHMWSEVWTGQWRALDAAMGTDRISAAWIRLGVYSLKLTDDRKTGMAGMLAFASDLDITVLEPTGRSGP